MIHPTAIVDARATVDPSAEIGPYVVIDGPVGVGARTKIGPHSVVLGRTVLGADNVLHAHVVLGDVPQDLAFAGGDTGLVVGDGNVFREYATVHRGTKAGTDTVLGNRGYYMQNSHVAHNCRIGDDCIVAGGALLAGYVEMGDRAFVSGNCVVHQFVRIGRLAFLRGISRTSRDVPPFCVMDGTHTVRTLNLVGLRRAGMPREEIHALRAAFRTLFLRPRNLELALRDVESAPMGAGVRELIEFIRASKRGVCFGPRAGAADAEAD